MAWKYVAKSGPTVKDWIGSWGKDAVQGSFAVGGAITEKTGDTININFSDSGSKGGPTGNPTETQLQFPVLDINTDVDTSIAKTKLMESFLVENTIFLQGDGVTLTLMDLVPGQPGGPPKIVRYHRQWHGSELLGVTVDLVPENPPGAPR
jgi:hypothetical protein